MPILHWYLFWIGVPKHNKTFGICFSVCRWGDYGNLMKNPHVMFIGDTVSGLAAEWCRLDSKTDIQKTNLFDCLAVQACFWEETNTMFLIRNIEMYAVCSISLFHWLQWQITLVELNVLTGTCCAEGADPLQVQSAVVEKYQLKPEALLPCTSIFICLQHSAFMSAQCPNFFWKSAFCVLPFIEGNSGGFII